MEEAGKVWKYVVSVVLYSVITSKLTFDFIQITKINFASCNPERSQGREARAKTDFSR